MPGQLTPDQLNDLVDILGGLYGEDIPQQPVEQDAVPQQKAVPTQPTPPTLPQEPMQQAAPPPEQPAVPQQPQMPAPMQPQRPKVKPSPFASKWHKSLLIQTKARRGRRLYTPTVANAPKPPETKPTKPPSTPTIGSLVYNARPERPPAAQPFQQVETPPPEVPQDQASILAKVKQEAEKKGGEQVGTNLAHVIRTRMVNPSIASQYQAASIFSLDELTKVLNEGHRAAPQEEIDLSQYHDDTSPFVVISHPRQTLTQGGAPAVVVGEPYVGLVHQLEAAFPGVNFFPAQEAPSELKRSASQVAKPMPMKGFLVSPYAKNFRRIGTKDEGEGTKPLPDPSTPKPQSRTTPAPATPNEPPSRQAGTKPLPASSSPPSSTPQPRTEPFPPPAESDNQRRVIASQGTTPVAPTPDQPHRGDVAPLVGDLNPDDFDDLDSFVEQVGQQAAEFAASQGMTEGDAAYFRADAMDKAEKRWKEFLQESKRHEELLAEYLPQVERTETGITLKEGKITNKTLIPEHTSNIAYLLEYENGTKGIFKPAALEGRGQLTGGRTGHPRMSITRGTFYKREALISYAARLLGVGHLIPETIRRSVDGQVGSVQHWVDGTQRISDYYDPGTDELQSDALNGEDLAYLAALDYVFANTDRNTSNAIVTPEGRVIGIDHGLSMPNSTLDITAAAKIRAMEILRHASYVKPMMIPLNIHHWGGTHWQTLAMVARKMGIEDDALKMAAARFKALIKHGGDSFGDLPAPDESDKKLGEWFPDVESRPNITARREAKPKRRRKQ